MAAQTITPSKRSLRGGCGLAGAESVSAASATLSTVTSGRPGVRRCTDWPNRKSTPRRWQLGLEPDRELAAVADVGAGLVDAGAKRRGLVQRRLDAAAALGVDEVKCNTVFGHPAQAGARPHQLTFAAQQHQQAARVLVFDRQAGRHLTCARLARRGQRQHRIAMNQVAGRGTCAPPAPEPAGECRPGQGRQSHRGVAPADLAEHLAQHARRSPRRDVAGSHHAGVREAGFDRDAGAAFEDRDLMAVASQLVGRCHADDAGPDDRDAH